MTGGMVQILTSTIPRTNLLYKAGDLNFTRPSFKAITKLGEIYYNGWSVDVRKPSQWQDQGITTCSRFRFIFIVSVQLCCYSSCSRWCACDYHRYNCVVIVTWYFSMLETLIKFIPLRLNSGGKVVSGSNFIHRCTKVRTSSHQLHHQPRLLLDKRNAVKLQVRAPHHFHLW